jgi:mono/diheme cytochrome c family protein
MRRAWLLAVALGLNGCGEPGTGGPPVERGRSVYLAQCTACHAADPSQAGSIGPAVRGSSRELLEAKLLRGAYPPGYAPKRPTALMAPMPQLEPALGDLAAYLRQ